MERLLSYRPKNRPPFKDPPPLALVMRGKVQYVGAIKGWNSPVYLALASRLRRRDPDYRPTLRSRIKFALRPEPRSESLAEGPTDYIHLAEAIKAFQAVGEFVELDLRFENPADQRGGGDELLKQCKSFARFRQKTPAVFIFDSDEPRVVAEVAGATGFKAWDNNVYSLVIPAPDFRDPLKPLCIELLYSDELLSRRDTAGRRLYRREEFDLDKGFHLTETVYTLKPKGFLVKDDDVIDLTTREKVALSKKAFAESIAARRFPYESVTFDGFRKLFEVLRAVRAYLLTQ